MEKKIIHQLDRIAKSPLFSRTINSTRLLRFLVFQVINGKEEEIKEYTIACEVFGLASHFDKQQNARIRVEAARLRKRLSEYYQTEGFRDPIYISIPKGGYIPEIHEWTSDYSKDDIESKVEFTLPEDLKKGRWILDYLQEYTRYRMVSEPFIPEGGHVDIHIFPVFRYLDCCCHCPQSREEDNCIFQEMQLASITLFFRYSFHKKEIINKKEDIHPNLSQPKELLTKLSAYMEEIIEEIKTSNRSIHPFHFSKQPIQQNS